SDLNVQSVVLAMTSLLMSLFITFVNILTIVVIRRTPFLRTLSNMYVTSLAASDLVVGLGLIPLSLFYIPSLRDRLFDRNIHFCAFIFGLNLGVSIVSSITMTLIATDRYIYILRPYAYKRVVTRRYVLVLVCLTWVFGVLYGLLPQLIHNDAAGVPKCDITLVMPVGYLFYTNLTIYSILIVLDFVLYTQILYTAYRQRRIIDAAAPVVSEPPSRKGNLRLKSIKFFLTVFGVYFMCLTPTVVCMGVDYYSPVPRFLYNTFNLLALMNSGINFVIYILLNVKFKVSVMRFL
ncbi:unnamed protein product, partial [Lymnaea stagnalis]